MKKKLKPCPFCGSSLVYLDSNNQAPHIKPIYAVGCYDCGANFPVRYSEEPLLAAWNKRTESQQYDEIKKILSACVVDLDRYKRKSGENIRSLDRAQEFLDKIEQEDLTNE